MPLTDAQLAALYPTVRSYVEEVVEVTLANVRAGYIPRSFTRDPAWYSDIRELISDCRASGRIDERIATKLLDRLDRAERRGRRGRRVRCAIVNLKQLVGWAYLGIRRDTAARDAVLRPTQALIALLWAAKDMERRGGGRH